MERLALLGATGSIGKSTLDVLSRHEDRFALYGASAHSTSRNSSTSPGASTPKSS